MDQTYDIEIRVLSCENCGAPFEASVAGGASKCEYCGTQMILGRRKLDAVRPAHSLSGAARIAKLRLQTGRALPDNPYSTVTPPPGCEGLTRSGQLPVIEQLERRVREALALVRAEPSFDHQRLLWWCATMLNQGYGMHDKQLERRAVLERAIEEIADSGFRHMLFVNLAGAAARFGQLGAAREWIAKCDPEPEDIMLDSGYRIGLASVLVRAGELDQILDLVGARRGDVPEAHQYRLMFALYRIHAYEARGEGGEALTAASAIASDPEVGDVVAEALGLNDLAPRTAAALDRGATAPGVSASSPPASEADQLQAALGRLDAGPGVSKNNPGAKIALLVLSIILIVFAFVAAIVVLKILPLLREAGAL